MNRFLFIAILAIAVNSFSYVEPCSTYTCDSLAIRAILDSNGLYDLPVDAVVRRTGPEERAGFFHYRSPEFTSLPKEIGKLSALEVLALPGNQLTSLPPEIGQLSSLKVLDLVRNQLTSLPPEIGLLDSLEILMLMSNQLTSLPPEILNLTIIGRLGIEDNKLCSLPDSIEAWIDENPGSRDWRETQDCSGCQDPGYLEYGTTKPCLTLVVYGCMHPDYEEYNPEANVAVADACKTLGIRMNYNQGPVISVLPTMISIDDKHTLKVLNVNGELVFSGSGTGPGDYSLSEYEPGIYFVNVTAGNRRFLKRIVVF